MNAQTTKNIQIKIRGVEVPPKLVLYGPNGAGKSVAIRSLFARMAGRIEAVRKLVDVDFASMLVDIGEEPAAPSLIFVTESIIIQHGAKAFNKDVVNFSNWSNTAIVNPEVVSKLYIDVYYDKFYDPDRGWQPLSRLSYGERRRLAIEAALAAADVVLIENFEAGLHVDAVVDLVKQIAESDATVVLETHSGLVLKAAVRFGISAYYVEPIARLKKIERLDDSELFARELSAWNAIVV